MNTSTELKRQLGIRTATALVVGEVIAVGIFLTPAGMAKSLGSPLWLLVVWLAMGAMALCGALCYGELAARYPQAGGGYVYLREAYGPAVAFMYGWMALLVMDPGLTAALAVGLASYAGYGFRLSPLVLKVVRRTSRVTKRFVMKSSGTPGGIASIVRHVGRAAEQLLDRGGHPVHTSLSLRSPSRTLRRAVAPNAALQPRVFGLKAP